MKSIKRKYALTKTLPAALSAAMLLFTAGCSDPAENPPAASALSPLSTVTPAPTEDTFSPVVTTAVSAPVTGPEQSAADTAHGTQPPAVTEAETLPDVTSPAPPETTKTPEISQAPETVYTPGTTTEPGTPAQPEDTGTEAPVTTAPESGKIPGIPDPPPSGEPDWRGHVHTWEIDHPGRSRYDLSCGKPCNARYRCSGCNVGMNEVFTVPAAEHLFENGRCIYCLQHDEEYLAAQGLTFAKNADGTCSVTGMSASCTYGVIVLPAEHDGAPVTSIADGAFAGRKTLTGVIFMGSKADEVRLGEPECRLVKIGDRAFDGCTSLTSFPFPDTLEEIGSYAFRSTNLGEISPSCAVRKLGSYAFYGAGVTRVLIENFRITEFEPYVFAESAIKEMVAPSTVTKTGDHAFENCRKLRLVIMPYQESYGECAFANCTALEYVYEIDPENTVIGKDAFLNCTAFRIPDTDPVTGLMYREYTALLPDAAAGYKTEQPIAVITGRGRWQGSDLIVPEKINGLPVYGCEGFSNDTKLRSVVFPEGFCDLYVNTFQNCPNLTEVIMPESMQVIGSSCFVGCTSLSRVILKNVEAEIYDGAFDGVYGFETAYDADGLIYRLSADGSSYFVYSFQGSSRTPKDLVIPSVHKGLPVTSIYKEAFLSARTLGSVTIPDSVTDIGEGAFRSAQIAKINLPKNLKVIPSGCFADNYAMERITLPEGLVRIGDSAFMGCTALQTPVIPDSVKEVDAFAFRECISMTDMPIGKGMTSIPEDYVQNCTSLKKITVPAWIKEVDRRAFSWTVKEVVYENPLVVLTGEDDPSRPLTWLPGVEYIYDEASGVRMYIGDGGAHVAGIAPGAAQIVALPAFCNGVPVVSIDDFAFMEAQNFVYGTKYVIPDSVTYLGRYAFRKSNIGEIDLGGLKEVPEYCFDSCRQLQTVTGNAVTSVGLNAFRQSGVSSLTLPALEEIGVGGFDGCMSLRGKSLTFDHLKQVGSRAFFSVTGLRVYTKVPDAVIAPDAALSGSSVEIRQ